MDIVAALVVGFVVGALMGGAMVYDRGWRNGVAWAQARIFGH
jgi:hypothetical protein